MPTYSTDAESDATRWTADTRHVLATWKTTPFVGHRNRHERVEQRVIIEYTHGVGVDIHRQVRSADSRRLPAEWTTIETIAVRDHGARYDRAPEARWVA